MMSSTASLRILVVDDNRLIREMVRDAFQQAGFQVEAAADGAEALELARAHRPDVVISDILMPVMDGWDLFRSIRGEPDLASVPFIFLTSEREAAKRVRGLRMGAEDYVTKPFAVEELVLRAQLIMDRHGPPASLQTPPHPVLSGHTSHLPIADLLQLLSSNGKTGILHLEAEEPGRVFFQEGRIVQAEIPRARGLKALYRLIAWPEADFRFAPGDLPDVGKQIKGVTAQVLMEGLVEMDEKAQILATGPGLRSVFRLCSKSRAEVEVEGLVPLEYEVLLAAKAGFTTQEVMDRSLATDGEVLKTLDALLDRKVIEVVEPGDEAPGGGGGV